MNRRFLVMPFDDVKKFSGAAAGKAKLLKEHPEKYLLRSIMAGFFIVCAVIFSNVTASVFAAAGEPAWGKFLSSLVFAIAVMLIVFIGSELFTGNNLMMAFGAFSGSVSWKDVFKVWAVSWFGNLLGCVLLTVFWVLAGMSGAQDYFASFVPGKLALAPGVMFFKAVLCNFFVCLAVACGTKCKEETTKFLMILMCIAAFVIAGFEHCIANMSVFTAALLVVPDISFAAVIRSMVIVTLGNACGGALLLALPLRLMSADE